MFTVGQMIKEARLKKNIKISELEKATKIKANFIKLIENNSWNLLPEYPVVSGFVKNLAVYLEISPDNANAFLRRDYPPRKLSINPKPDIQTKFFWSPKLAFFLGVLSLVLIILSYLGYEYLKFIKPPEIEIYTPRANEAIFESKVFVSGKTTTDSTLSINNQPILIDQYGQFATEILLTKETKELKFVAVSRSGKTTEIVKSISVEY